MWVVLNAIDIKKDVSRMSCSYDLNNEDDVTNLCDKIEYFLEIGFDKIEITKVIR